MTIETISVTKLAELHQQDAVEMIDVRTPAEFRQLHADFARNVPLDSLDPKHEMQSRTAADDQPLYIVCQMGGRSMKACEQFVAAGFTNVVNVEGGTAAWNKAGLPVVRGKKSMSLERQVRICAGLITLAGSVAAIATNNVYFAGIPAFIGAGLAFAGITDTCGMAMVLAKMPWNR